MTKNIDIATMICQKVYENKWVEGTHGNLSFRSDNANSGRLITQTGCFLKTPIFVDINDGDASSDAGLHKEMYRLANVDWIVHFHAPLIMGETCWYLDGHGVWCGFKGEMNLDKINVEW